ncbi:hypothetical protein Pla123a_11710 [Posidoniimonas polymericola]|uniref:Uncharacterized protein n=1 Tax=Posidoniimonas polymericola TaxID=2528002 RepID=A0A5C5YU76_9BACT|nr:hypothetical protein Pla123a_11710 [Posidoniimonas polymericola]
MPSSNGERASHCCNEANPQSVTELSVGTQVAKIAGEVGLREATLRCQPRLPKKRD